MKRWLFVVAVSALLGISFNCRAEDKPAAKGDMEELKLELPKPAFKETPKTIPAGMKVEKLREGPRPAYMVPKGCVNLAHKKPVTSSDKDPVIGSLDLITDGDKEATEGSYVELARGVQWVQIDLQKEGTLHAIVIWHYHGQARVYHSVIVQVANDPDFITDVKTIYNNDYENTAGLGAGTDLGYWEGYEGKIIDAKAVKGRYVRLYSAGNTSDDQNHYTEVECWGIPQK